MDIENILTKKNYSVPKTVMEQKDARLAGYKSIFEALNDKSLDVPLDGNSTITVLSLFGKMSELNLTGTLIWECLKNNKSLEEIKEQLNNYFEEDLDEDIKTFVKDLINKKLLEVKNDSV